MVIYYCSSSSLELGTSCGAILPSERQTLRGTLVRNLCSGGDEHVSQLLSSISDIMWKLIFYTRIVAGVLYWYVWTILLPKWRGYTLEEETEVLGDGTSITRLVHKYE